MSSFDVDFSELVDLYEKAVNSRNPQAINSAKRALEAAGEAEAAMITMDVAESMTFIDLKAANG
ncbi:hypothetical protein [Mesorhizobium sp.]|uniref:hypothetical protein n=1 Tax=Mesorhizobium sp. TaxID=1871066 RepID=UPI001205DCD0|nr:hypothetical protein [Mesorhizobium sp.]TIL31697.1 MAG: hypothetical protein E5Y82_29895 [Mesorhizobium sp.]